MDVDVIYNQDCLEGMKSIPDESIDLIVTDPPYITTSRGCAGNSGGMLQKDINKKGMVFKHNNTPHMFLVKVQSSLMILVTAFLMKCQEMQKPTVVRTHYMCVTGLFVVLMVFLLRNLQVLLHLLQMMTLQQVRTGTSSMTVKRLFLIRLSQLQESFQRGNNHG